MDITIKRALKGYVVFYGDESGPDAWYIERAQILNWEGRAVRQFLGRIPQLHTNYQELVQICKDRIGPQVRYV